MQTTRPRIHMEGLPMAQGVAILKKYSIKVRKI